MRRMFVTSCAALALLIGCDTDDDLAVVEPDETAGEALPVEPAAEEAEAEGDTQIGERFTATLSPLNDSGVSGTATIEMNGDQAILVVEASGLAPGPHRQMIHVGDACPEPGADENDDGVIAVTEGMPSYQRVLIPLDDQPGDLSQNQYPEVGEDGQLQYRQTISVSQLTDALRQPDPNPDDPLARLGEGEELDLGQRTLVIHGVAEDRELPDTVESIPNVDAQDSVPVACATFRPVSV